MVDDMKAALRYFVFVMTIALLGACAQEPLGGAGSACVSSGDCVDGAACVSGICVEQSSGGCLTNSDCASGQLCNTQTMMCVDGPTACMNQTDCPENQRCDGAQGICVDGRRPCTGMADCPGSQVCDTMLGLCVECLGNNDCVAPATCQAGVCVGPAAPDGGVGMDVSSAGGQCTMDSECGPPTRVCESQQCVLGCNEFGGLSCDPNSEVCDTNTGRCVVVAPPCTMDSECAPPQSVCEQGQCVGGCAIPGGIQCVGGMTCDMATGRCVMGGPICRDDTDCMPPSTICNLNTGACDPGCGTTGCTAPQMCNTMTGYCETGEACTDDTLEQNDSAAAAATINAGTQPNLSLCPSDDDYYKLALTTGQSASVEITFLHGEGNLDLEVTGPGGTVITNSTSQTDDEAVSFTAMSDGDHVVRVFSVRDFGPKPGNQYAMVTTVSGGGGGMPTQCPSDMFEPNDSISAAPVMAAGQYPTLSICPSDDDYYAITLAAGEQLDVSIISILLEGIVQSELLDASGTIVATAMSSLLSDDITYTSMSGGTYYLHINLLLDLGSVPGNNYGVILSTQTGMGGGGTGGGTGGMCMDDTYEENDSAAAASSMMVTDYTGLAACDMDDDFYRFSLTGGENVSFIVEFMDGEGDIDIELQSATGSILASAASASDNESFSYDVPSTDDYVLRVYLYQDSGTVDGNTYDLRVRYCDGDLYEPNNTQATASAISSGAYPNLRLCVGAGDYYRINTSVGDALDLTTMFDSSEGDIDLVLFDASGTQVASTSGVTGTERIMYTTTSTGAHVLRVFLYQDAGNAPGVDYELTVTR